MAFTYNKSTIHGGAAASNFRAFFGGQSRHRTPERRTDGLKISQLGWPGPGGNGGPPPPPPGWDATWDEVRHGTPKGSVGRGGRGGRGASNIPLGPPSGLLGPKAKKRMMKKKNSRRSY